MEEEEVCRGRKRRRLDETSEPVSRRPARSSRRRGRATEAKIAKERRRKRGLRKISLPGQRVDWISQTTNTTASSGDVIGVTILRHCL